MNILSKILKWLNDKNPVCDGCGKHMDSMFSEFRHFENCIEKPLGYNIYTEKFEPSTRAYFFKLKQKE